MSGFEKLFHRPDPEHAEIIKNGAAFAAEVRKAIQLIGAQPGSLNDLELIQLLCANYINREYAAEIQIFLPIAFCRLFYAEVDWTDSYAETVGGKMQRRKKFSETNSYIIILDESRKYFLAAPRIDVIVKISSRSAEYNVIRQIKKMGASLGDIAMTEIIIAR